MHIPDGYLSPATCAALYVTAAPFWYMAAQRIKRLLSTRLVPLLSVFAAFSFVIMMFNLPLPGGTTGHAVGVGIATIVLGPWGAMLAISIALLIQAIFFGDGGITALGANCFNMAIIGSLVAHLVYRGIAGRSALTSSRRVIAAALAGYGAINAAALCAAIEFGIQPLLYKDATGTPLYAPFPLTIAIPAMMIGHLTFAGLAELIVTGGVVAYLQRSDVSLLKFTAPRAVVANLETQTTINKSGWRATRPLWIGLAGLMILTPLGLLAAGTAWGEWGAQDFADPATRDQITAASGNHAPPDQPPKELERLSKIWTAPISDYAPPFMKSAAFGYMMSAAVGTGLIILIALLFGWIARRQREPDANPERNVKAEVE
jgi:cobalt/nickel transport system permease protein